MQLEPLNGHPSPVIDLSQYLDGLYSYGMVLSRNPTDAEDLVQETCLRALRAMGRLRPESNVKSWLFTILRNIWLNQLRQQRTAPEIVELDVDENSANKAVSSAKDPHEAWASKAACNELRAAIRQLPVEFREVILLREYEELSYEEIAAMLQCPAGTVMSRLARARIRLRESLSAMSKASTAGENGVPDIRDTKEAEKPGRAARA
jgi:RNA polymerase sigma-70 factor, ECF subfamily